MCSIAQNSDIAELLKRTSLLYGMKPMQGRYAFECLDRTLRDIMKYVSVDRGEKPFGGITMLLGGDFRQILPVVPKGSRSDIVGASTSSPLWCQCKLFKLVRNMRLNVVILMKRKYGGTNSVSGFWILVMGRQEIVPELEKVPGLPPHDLVLKEGLVVMLLRNMNQSLGLCNGTRMIVRKCLKHTILCEIMTGHLVELGTSSLALNCAQLIQPFLSISFESSSPFKFVVPVQVCFAMTINKSQGQSLDHVGLYLPESVFCHGQYYVVVSRVTSPDGLIMLIEKPEGGTTSTTKNVVYEEVFYDLES
ncbi:uncharacterized protein LOC141691608 [Apium graveolens]|uniref:uncharacterized protein LOC141691608 n=1 Tax=Apium graveolens TaxID=4045 RepID=UPI003D7B2D67